jgi:hypothetical protein
MYFLPDESNNQGEVELSNLFLEIYNNVNNIKNVKSTDYTSNIKIIINYTLSIELFKVYKKLVNKYKTYNKRFILPDDIGFKFPKCDLIIEYLEIEGYTETLYDLIIESNDVLKSQVQDEIYKVIYKIHELRI